MRRPQQLKTTPLKTTQSARGSTCSDVHSEFLHETNKPKESHAAEKMLGRDAAALAGRLAAGDPAFDWQPLATFMAAASAPDETTEAAATNEARAFAVPEQEEEEARAAAAPPALRSQDEAPGSSAAAPIVFDDDEEDATPGGTAPLPPAQAVAGQLGQPSSSSAPLRRDPAAVPAARAGTRPPSRLDEAAWGAYVYKNNKTETWRATWGFTGDTKKYGLKVKKDATILGAKSMLSKEAAAVKRYEALLLYGEHERIPWDLHELHLKRRALDSIADRALLAEVRAVVRPSHGFPNPFGEWEMVQRLAKRPCHELAQLVVLAAKLAPAIESQGGHVEGATQASQGEHGQVAIQAMTAATAASTQPVLSTQEVEQLARQPEWVDGCARYGECEEDEEEDGEEEGEEEEEEEEV